MPSVLFVCTANVCRSPMAAGLFRMIVKDHPEDHWEIESAGVWAMEGGQPAFGVEQVLLREFDVDIRDHRSRRITPEIIDRADLILVMELAHKEAIDLTYPDHGYRVYLFSEMIEAFFDIQDPVGGTPEDYLTSAQQIHSILIEGYPWISKLASKYYTNPG